MLISSFERYSALVFVIVLGILIYRYRKSIELQKIAFPFFYFLLYRSKAGLSWMDRFAKKYPKILHVIATISTYVGFIGMVFSIWFLFRLATVFINTPDAPAQVIPVIPGINTPFWFLLISLATLIIIHESSHGVLARLYKIKLKSSGLAIFGIIIPILPAAFVEPDEKALAKRPAKEQLAVYSAGSFSNIVTALLLLLVILFLIPPINAKIMDQGVVIAATEVGFPANLAGIPDNSLVETVNGIDTADLDAFVSALHNVSVGDTVILKTDKGTYPVITAESPHNSSQAYLGVNLNLYKVKGPLKEKYGETWFLAILWIYKLLGWMFNVHLSVGLINLCPLFITDGGKMLYVTLKDKMKNQDLAVRIWNSVNMFCVILIFINLAFPFFRKMLLGAFGLG